jgi:hypothetical protein
MNALIDFFALRPVFSLLGLRVLWLAFLAQQGVTLAAVLNNPGYFAWEAWYALLTFLFHIAVNIALVRLLIEVAMTLLVRPLRATEAVALRSEGCD